MRSFTAPNLCRARDLSNIQHYLHGQARFVCRQTCSWRPAAGGMRPLAATVRASSLIAGTC